MTPTTLVWDKQSLILVSTRLDLKSYSFAVIQLTQFYALCCMKTSKHRHYIFELVLSLEVYINNNSKNTLIAKYCECTLIKLTSDFNPPHPDAIKILLKNYQHKIFCHFLVMYKDLTSYCAQTFIFFWKKYLNQNYTCLGPLMTLH